MLDIASCDLVLCVNIDIEQESRHTRSTLMLLRELNCTFFNAKDLLRFIL